MKRIVQATLLLLLTPLAACEYHKLQQLNYAEPVGDPFQKALWANYRDLTREEERNYDWEQAVTYADKALRSAYGEEVLPSDPTQKELPDGYVKQFEKAREDLVNILAGDAKSVQPQLVADAQTNFDCWLEHQAENFNAENIEVCRDAFYAAMQQLITPKEIEKIAPPPAPKKSVSKKPVVKTPEPPAPAFEPAPAPAPALEPVPAPTPTPEPTLAPVPAPEAAPFTAPEVAPVAPTEPVPFNPPKEPAKEEPPPAAAPAAPTEPSLMKPLSPQSMQKPAKEVETASYIVFFDSGQSVLNPTAEKIVDGAAQSVLPHKTYRVIVNARNDLFGNVETGLPTQRAQMVKNRLILQGVSENSIDILSGEASPAAGPTSTPVERRVEIFISE